MLRVQPESAVYNIKWTIYNVQLAVHSVHYTVKNLQITKNSLQPVFIRVMCTVYSVQSQTLFTHLGKPLTRQGYSSMGTQYTRD